MDDLELRRNLGRGRRGRRRGDATREPLADGETREPRQTREPRDATKEPCAVTFQNDELEFVFVKEILGFLACQK